ncbi:PilZ domain-containing protein [Tardiphaga sp.]|uniref:PilZ domain-containing protein n=1 Tax=Tardiphaga sp. TaxID=1926292 RepID=UPI002629D8C6|nr:PilZ domain-containing protein [Tardiphaga sp.]MDB5617406.1 hypothetical protein [Tardiphaga sp.]
MVYGNRKSGRVEFAKGMPARMVGIDGTWQRHCLMFDVSQTGARLSIKGSLHGLDISEFLLVLSSTGPAFRRCRIVRIADEQLGIEFIRPDGNTTRQHTIKPRMMDDVS